MLSIFSLNLSMNEFQVLKHLQFGIFELGMVNQWESHANAFIFHMFLMPEFYITL